MKFMNLRLGYVGFESLDSVRDRKHEDPFS